MMDEEDGTHHHDESARGVSSSSSSRHAQKILQLAPGFWHEAGRDENLDPQLRIWADRRLTILFKPSMAVRVYFPLFFFLKQKEREEKTTLPRVRKKQRSGDVDF